MTLTIDSERPIAKLEYGVFASETEAHEAATNARLLHWEAIKTETSFHGQELPVDIGYGMNVSMLSGRELSPWYTRYLAVVAHYRDGEREGKVLAIHERLPIIAVSFR
jgi:hypothetical protein